MAAKAGALRRVVLWNQGFSPLELMLYVSPLRPPSAEQARGSLARNTMETKQHAACI
jgi:hypothetical protein